MHDIQAYQAEDGSEPYARWLAGLADRQARARVLVRVQRMAAGNFGDCKPCRDGVWELREDFGPGYRIYYARSGKTVVLLLCGGDKRSQHADIERAVACWKDYQRRKAS